MSNTTSRLLWLLLLVVLVAGLSLYVLLGGDAPEQELPRSMDSSGTGGHASLVGAPEPAGDATPPSNPSSYAGIEVRVVPSSVGEAVFRVTLKSSAGVDSQESQSLLFRFRVPCSSPTVVRLRAQDLHRGLASPERTVRIVPGGQHSIRLVVKFAEVRGIVVDDATGEPVVGAEVREFLDLPEDASAEQLRAARSRARSRSDENGEFILLYRPGEETVSTIAAYHRDFRRGLLQITSSQSRVELRLAKRARFTGQVLLEGGRPAPGAHLRIQVLSGPDEHDRERDDNDPWESLLPWLKMSTRGKGLGMQTRSDLLIRADEHGRFDTPLPFPGSADVTVAFPEYETAALRLTREAYRDPVEVVLRESRMRGARLRIIRVDGTPLRRVLVFVQDDMEGLGQRTLLRAKTDQEGWINTSSLIEGERVLVTVVGDPDDAQSDQPPIGGPHPWVVTRREEFVARKWQPR